jgi:hypothetical protein
MLSEVFYYRLMTSFYAYSAVSSGVLVIIFGMITVIPHFRRKLFVLITLTLLLDTIGASLASRVSESFLIDAKFSSVFDRIDIFIYGLGGLFILMYVSVRIFFFFDSNSYGYKWPKESVIVRACCAIHIFFPSLVGLLIFIHCIVFIGWLIWSSWAVIKWPLQYLINDQTEVQRNLVNKLVTRSTSISNKMINTTGIPLTAFNITKSLQ